MERGELNLSASHEMDEDYPDRVNNPQDYASLLQSGQIAVPTYGIRTSS